MKKTAEKVEMLGVVDDNWTLLREILRDIILILDATVKSEVKPKKALK